MALLNSRLLSSLSVGLLINPPNSGIQAANSHNLWASNWLWQGLILHARILQHVCPLAARPCMTVLEMLSKVIRPKELFRVVAFPELMHIHQVLNSDNPVTFCGKMAVVPVHRSATTLKLVTAVSTGVHRSVGVRGVVECICILGQSGTRPRMTPKVKRVLVTLCFVFVLESILAVGALVLFLGLVCSISWLVESRLL